MAGKLTAVGVKSEKLAAGLHSDGDGLYLNVAASGAKSWRFIWRAGGKRREMGCGAFPTVSLAEARDLAAAARKTVAAGGDPIAERREAKRAGEAAAALPTFAEAAEQYIADMEAGWRNKKHATQWRSTIEAYCGPFADKPVSDVTTDLVLEALKPVWIAKAETASRVRGRIERILDHARVKGWREGENPARWRGHLQALLPARQKLQRGHHAAMPYDAVPPFMKALRSRPAIAARCLEFAILTAARSGEARGATWNEIDLDASVWTIPAARMKAGKEHRVPLTGRALEIVKELAEMRTGDYAFPGQRLDRPLSETAVLMLMRRMGVGHLTMHGFRSSFRDWCGDATAYPRDVAETALAHRVGDATERAYRRGDAFAKRRALMTDWDAFCAGTGAAQEGAGAAEDGTPEADPNAQVEAA